MRRQALGKAVSRTFATREEAERWAEAVETSGDVPESARHLVRRDLLRELGCSQDELSRERRRWHGMMKRCYDPKHRAYRHYGGRGIVVCERWHTFENFVRDMGVAPPGKSMDREDNSGPYSPGNCRWATSRVQASNKRAPKLDPIASFRRALVNPKLLDVVQRAEDAEAAEQGRDAINFSRLAR